MTDRRQDGRAAAQTARRWHASLTLACALALLLGGCALGGSATTPNGATPSQTINLGQVRWCDTPDISFQDDSTTAQQTITSWDAVKTQLGFTPYLPASLPQGTCLALAGGSIHDPIFGAHLSITYVLPKIGALSFSEAPKRTGLAASVQCIVSGDQPTTTPTTPTTATPGAPTATPQPPQTEVCLGTVENTSITLASRQTAAELETLFKALKPGLDWVPVGTASVSPTATSTPATPATTATAGS